MRRGDEDLLDTYIHVGESREREMGHLSALRREESKITRSNSLSIATRQKGDSAHSDLQVRTGTYRKELKWSCS